VVFAGPMDASTFLGDSRQCLTSSLRFGDIIVMDNPSSRKAIGIRQAIEAAGADLFYLPTYRPDLNPIEKIWSKVKACLRRVSAKTFDTSTAALGDALNVIHIAECSNDFNPRGDGGFSC
jgi:transposase